MISLRASGVSIWALGVCYQVAQRPSSRESKAPKEGDSFINEGLKSKNPSPPANSFPIPKLFQIPQELFSRGLTKEDEKRLGVLQQFCKEHNISLPEVLDLARRIKTETTTEKLDVLTIVALLLSLKKGKANKFYRTNKSFIDTVLAKIREGKLKVKDARGQKNPGALAIYKRDRDEFCVIKDLDLLNPLGTQTIIHELFHFYQDIQRLKQSVSSTEVDAYVKGGEYVVHTVGLTKPGQEKAIEELFDRREREDKMVEDKEGVFVAYYRTIGKSKKAQEWLGKLEYKVTSVIYLREVFWMLKRVASEMVDDVFKSINAFHYKTVRQKIDRATIEELKKKLDREKMKRIPLGEDLATYLKGGKKAKLDPHLISEKLRRYAYQCFYFYLMRKFIAMMEANLNSGKDVLFIPSSDDFFDVTTDQDFEESIRFLHSLRVFSYYTATHDGVK